MEENQVQAKEGCSKSKEEMDNLVAQLQDARLDTRSKQKNYTFDDIIEGLQARQFRNIITMVGAGISTAAGIPDFRSSGTGLYENLSEFCLPYPQAIFEIHYFKQDPKPFYKLVKKIIHFTSARPTKAHYFVKLLEDKELLLRHYTQNIDNLDRQAGISEDKLVEAHGSFHLCKCIDCGKTAAFETIKEDIMNDIIPSCSKCRGIIKPNITFFGENLPKRFFDTFDDDVEKCDLLIIMGSSLTVQPFASICRKVNSSCPRLLINKNCVGQDEGLKCHLSNNGRDVAALGECDDICSEIVNKLCWQDEWNILRGSSS